MSRVLIAFILVSSFSTAALAWGFEKSPRKAHQQNVESPHKHRRHVAPIEKQREEPDSAFHREYWEPCNSTFREYIVNGCTGG